ncbi:transcriptional Coactivator p15-domain-containing protein [Trametes meyenii]|nr:transcriptional Coactivator p15-domain-containing protein [Trametes meyenii]
MAKRKAVAESSDEDEFQVRQHASDSESSDEQPIQTARRGGKKVKKQGESDEEIEEGGFKPAKKTKASKPVSIKKPRRASAAAEEDHGDLKVGVNELGEKYVDLGKKRRATVRQFKGATFLDIREFYGDESDLKPGKKGISLTKEQWEALKQSSDAIDAFFAKLKK